MRDRAILIAAIGLILLLSLESIVRRRSARCDRAVTTSVLAPGAVEGR